MTDPSPNKASSPIPRAANVPGTLIIILIPVIGVIIFAGGILIVKKYSDMKTHQSVAMAGEDLRSLGVAITSYQADNGSFPAMAKSRQWSAGAYVLPDEVPPTRTFRMRHDTNMNTLTTPVAYMAFYPSDAFREFKGTTYSYHTDGTGWIVGSWGPNMDQSLGGDLQWQRGTLYPEYVQSDGDLEELNTGERWSGNAGRVPVPGQGVASVYTGWGGVTDWLLTGNHDEHGVGAFTYDPTNGTFSAGDIWHVMQQHDQEESP